MTDLWKSVACGFRRGVNTMVWGFISTYSADITKYILSKRSEVIYFMLGSMH